ncbi:MAG: regulator of sirC expression with transglutaminase-like and TPR domain [Planctomycetota bacterium]|jgi:regulator of sirC expression with transglutaminase-like and TPR domain
MPGEIEALIKLLEDDSATVITAVDDRLKALVPKSLPFLRQAQDSNSARVRGRARELLRGLSLSASIERLIEMASKPNPDLEEMVLWLGRLQNPGLSFDQVRLQLDDLAAQATTHLEGVADSQKKIEAFLKFIHKDLGFIGDTVDFHAYVNNFLSTVIDRRKGMPITLILVYILVGKRLGIHIDAIGSPYRALAFYRDSSFETYIDAFGGGRMWTHHDCVSYLKTSGFKNPDAKHFLRRLSAREITERIARNLINFCTNAGREAEGQELRRLAQALVQNRDQDI